MSASRSWFTDAFLLRRPTPESHRMGIATRQKLCSQLLRAVIKSNVVGCPATETNTVHVTAQSDPDEVEGGFSRGFIGSGLETHVGPGAAVFVLRRQKKG